LFYYDCFSSFKRIAEIVGSIVNKSDEFPGHPCPDRWRFGADDRSPPVPHSVRPDDKSFDSGPDLVFRIATADGRVRANLPLTLAVAVALAGAVR
jgi:hypothetical protein